MLNMFTRQIEPVLKDRLSQFPVVVLTGPRQSGKTTLLEQAGHQYDYINLESPDQLEQMQLDPKSILNKPRKKGLIIDEAQRYPDVFSYIQVISDKAKKAGQFILSGSQNFLLSKQVTQSLAGRAGILELLPLSYPEYQTHPEHKALSLWEWLYCGGYPRPYQNDIPINVWMDNYVRTYLERDVRDLLKVRDLSLFQRFLKLCAGRHGQLLNTHELSIDAGISHTTVMHWLSVLEASYLVFRLQPYHENFNKRLIKSPKLYFYDSGLVCYLLGIDSPDHLSLHVSRGAIFEGYVISEIQKHFLNTGLSQQLFFWRDSNGIEVDCVFELHGKIQAVEIKSTETFRGELLKGLKKWQQISSSKSDDCALVYAGNESLSLLNTDIVSWFDIDKFLKEHS